jgi:hypothetical protein
MDKMRINEVQSRMNLTDSQVLLDPHVMREIERRCLKAWKEQLERDKHVADERRLTSGVSSDE